MAGTHLPRVNVQTPYGKFFILMKASNKSCGFFQKIGYETIDSAIVKQENKNIL